MPNATGTFGQFPGVTPFSQVCLSQGHAYFVGREQGIYEAFEGNLSRVVDLTTPVPGGSGTFASNGFQLARPQASGVNVAFGGTDNTVSGVYARLGGTLGVVVDRNMDAPGGGKFSGFGNETVGIDGTTVAFDARYGSSGQSIGVFKKVGSTISTLADFSTAIPNGTGNFTELLGTRLDAGLTTFFGRGSGGQTGIYRHDGTALSRLVDKNTPAPGGFSFTGLGPPAVDGEDIAFVAGTTGPGAGGLFTRKNNTIQLVVDVATPLPDGGTLSNGFGAFTIGAGMVVFSPASGGQVYTDAGGTIQKIIGPGDLLDGKIVSEAFNFTAGQDGNQVALLVRFQGVPEYEAIYSVTVPAVGVLVPAAPAMMLALIRRRR